MQSMQILDQSGTVESEANEIDPSWWYGYLSYQLGHLASSNHLMTDKNKTLSFTFALSSFQLMPYKTSLCTPYELIISPD
jgi:hypothetical protein